MIYRPDKPIKKDGITFARVVLWTIIIGSIAALTIYLVLLKIDADLRQEIQTQEQIYNQRIQPKEAIE